MAKIQNPEEINAYISELVKKAKIAQKEFERNYTTQRSVDEVVRAAGKAVVDNGVALAQDAVAETSIGNIEGKVFKLTSIALCTWNYMKGKKSVGFLDDDPAEPGVRFMAKPLGVIGCVMPSTNPIATVVGNTMNALKCRNAVIIAPHPTSARASKQTVDFIRAALKEIGAPVDLVQCIGTEEASIAATSELLQQCDVNIATGGAGMVKGVYSAGKPAFGVGQGNCQVLIDESWADMNMTCATAIGNRITDMGVPCTGEQTMILPASMEEKYLEAMKASGAYIIEDPKVIDKLREVVFPDGRNINRGIVGRSPQQIGDMIGVDVPAEIKVLCLKNQARGKEDVLCKEILCPIIRYTTYTDFKDGVEVALANLYYEGAGHSSSIWSTNQENIDYAANLIPVGRFHVNQATVGGANTAPYSITIGCGSWGNNSISENLQYYHLMNKTRVTYPMANLRMPEMSDWDDFEVYNIVQE